MPQEAAFWENLAVYVTLNKPRPYNEQLIFMRQTEDIARRMMTGKFRWAMAKDKVALVDELAAVLAGQGLAAMYRRLPQLTYQDKPLPRAVAANLASYAITQWWAEQ